MEGGEPSQIEEEGGANEDVRNIEKDVAIITVLKSNIIQLKSVAYEREASTTIQPKATETINKYEEELSSLLIHKRLVKTYLQSATLQLLLGQETETSQTVISLLKQYGNLLQQLRKIEIKEVNLQIMKKKMEYVDKLNAFNRMLEQQKKQQQSSPQHRQTARIKEELSQKLEKINIMRMIMLNIICNSTINYIENPQYSEMASRLLEPITFQTLKVKLTE